MNKNFQEWACSLSGCDGGNPQADIWLCGIEWGFDTRKASAEDYYTKELPLEIDSGKVTHPDSYDWNGHLKYPYGRNVAKLYTAIRGGKVEDYQLIEKLPNNELFKLNLYPIAFNSTDDNLWKQYGLDELTGFQEKILYQTWCFLHRFPAIAKRVSEQNPPIKCIVCTGISYLTDFFVCFASHCGAPPKIDVTEIKSGENITRKIYHARLNNGTLLAVIPFFSGVRGLNSNDLLQQVGDKIREMI